MDWNKDNPRYKLPDNYKTRDRARPRNGFWARLRASLKKALIRWRRPRGPGERPGFEDRPAAAINLMTGLRRAGAAWRAALAGLAQTLAAPLRGRLGQPRLLAFLAGGALVAVLGWQGLKKFGPDTWPVPEPPLAGPIDGAAPLPERLPPPPTVPEGTYESAARFWGGLERASQEIQAGDSLSQVCDNLNLAGREQASFLKALSEVQKPQQLRPGSRLTVFRNKNGLVKVEFWPPNASRPKILACSSSGVFKVIDPSTTPTPVLRASQGQIEATLWDAAMKAGLPAELVSELADLFAYEVDFLADIKNGDRFQVMYEQKYQDGRPLGKAQIELAILETGGRRLELYRHQEQDGTSGFFDLEGRSNKKNFFVTPLQYTRISSHYNLKRMHPILKRVRAHEGVDYAAPTGTPVVSVADGAVVFAGWKGGYGKLLTVKHSNVYLTMYAHLSGFAPGLKNGAKVSQGEVIGYVGSTGLSTGPHLDFRLKKNGQFVDPVSELSKQQANKVLGKDEKTAFKLGARQKTDKMIELLKSRS